MCAVVVGLLLQFGIVLLVVCAVRGRVVDGVVVVDGVLMLCVGWCCCCLLLLVVFVIVVVNVIVAVGVRCCSLLV